MGIEGMPKTIWWEDDRVYLVDQSRLPLVGDVLVCSISEGVCTAIRTMAVRGAPALGVAAALGIALWVRNESEEIDDPREFLLALAEVADKVAATRPTAVNLAWGAERVKRFAFENADLPLPRLRSLIVEEALAMQAEDEERNRAIGANGAALLSEDVQVLTHCNAGSLATVFYGTALGVIFAAQEAGKRPRVWVDETRPVLQGARLTAWELRMANVPFKLITDNMAASIMARGWVDAVVVGADHIAANGDTANKIGTYGLAVLAKEHGLPFYVAAPTSTVDMTLPSGEGIVIEERDPREVAGVTVAGTFEARGAEDAKALESLTAEGPYEFGMARGHQLEIRRKGDAYQFDGWFRVSPPDIDVYNPAFDVTPASYITAIITERGVARPDLGDSLREMTSGSGSLHELGVE